MTCPHCCRTVVVQSPGDAAPADDPDLIEHARLAAGRHPVTCGVIAAAAVATGILVLANQTVSLLRHLGAF